MISLQASSSSEVGVLAGLYYGYEKIPQEWIAVIKRKEWIEELCRQAEIEL